MRLRAGNGLFDSVAVLVNSVAVLVHSVVVRVNTVAVRVNCVSLLVDRCAMRVNNLGTGVTRVSVRIESGRVLLISAEVVFDSIAVRVNRGSVRFNCVAVAVDRREVLLNGGEVPVPSAEVRVERSAVLVNSRAMDFKSRMGGLCSGAVGVISRTYAAAGPSSRLRAMRISILLFFAASMLYPTARALAQGGDATTHTRADSLRGSNGAGRAWWDATFYDLHVRVSPRDSSVAGYNRITYRVLRPSHELQLDLQTPLVLDSVIQDGRRLVARADGNAYFVALFAPQQQGAIRTVAAYYHGQPGHGREAPWNSGVVWTTDSLGAPWLATTNELTGASIWWPLKDYLGDEPDSQRIAITVPDPMIEVSNGRLRGTTHHTDGTTTYEWFVAEPINTYDVAVNAGAYSHFADTLEGKGGKLTLDFWPLAMHADTAKAQWRQASGMLQCFEDWFGPYPWYADGYKLIEAPYLGMEHQSGIAYGNHFLDGYLGRDLSGTGLGLGWDYIIIHESAHEWFGNSITTRESGDLWVHESFATYAEGLYTECRLGRTAGSAYLIGLRNGIRNTGPIVGPRGIAGWYNGDMYFKGANVLHTIRQLVDDDVRWREVLRGLNTTFRHRLVTGREIEDYIGREARLDLRRVFDQYFTTTLVPRLDYKVERGALSYRWTEVVPGFAMPVRVQIPGLGTRWLRPTDAWRKLVVPSADGAALTVDENFYVTSRNVAAGHS